MKGCNISREVAMIPVCEGISPNFVMYYLASSEAKEFILGNTKGVAQQGINLGDLRELPTPLPSAAEQRQAVQRIENAFNWIDRLASETTSARNLVDHLDQAVAAKAFRGELVPQNPNDEPASVLLERIKPGRADTRPARRGRRTKAGVSA
jgi:type I restriction enzyme S subunit